MTVIITELRNDLEPDRDPAFNPNVFSEDEEEAAQAAQAAAQPTTVSAPSAAGTSGSKSAFQSVGRSAVVPPEPPSGVNVAFCSVVTSPVGAGKRSPPPAELSLGSRNHVVVGGSSPTGDAEAPVNCRPSPISSSNTIVDLSGVNDATPTGAPPLAVAIAPALPGVTTANAKRLKGSEVNALPSATLNASTNPLPSNQRKRRIMSC